MTDDPRAAEAYQSALDLPSFRDLLQQIGAAKVLTRFVARDKRPELVRLENEVREMTERVDRFYELLGPRHWIFHESLPTNSIDALLNLSPRDAERALIALYADPERLGSFIRLRTAPLATRHAFRRHPTTTAQEEPAMVQSTRAG